MGNAGLNPQKNSEEYRRMIFVCSIIQETRNKLEGKKPGEVTIAGPSGQKDEIGVGEPVIDTTSSKHQMGIDDKKKEAYRTVVVNGKQVQAKLKDYKEIKMKYAEWKKREGIEDKDKDAR